MKLPFGAPLQHLTSPLSGQNRSRKYILVRLRVIEGCWFRASAAVVSSGMARQTFGCDDSLVRLGATLDPDYRIWLLQLALDLAFHGMLSGRLEYLNGGAFSEPWSGRSRRGRQMGLAQGPLPGRAPDLRVGCLVDSPLGRRTPSYARSRVCRDHSRPE
jgi:hypothetical protein